MKSHIITTDWRATGPYTPNNASKTGLLDEIRLYLQTYDCLGSTDAAREELVNGGLPQRSRATRQTVVRVIQERLVRWNPPTWVLDELVSFAREPLSDALTSALLLHAVRQDMLLYDFVQDFVLTRWRLGEREVVRADVQKFMDDALSCHPEIGAWTTGTRAKLAGNVLSILRDYGLMEGKARKHIIEPIVPPAVVRHLVHLLRQEGSAAAEIPHHPDWHIFLWDAERAQEEIEKAQ